MVLKRMLELQGGVNFRELGGYHTITGKTVKYHKLLRSGNMNDLTDQDLNYLYNYGLRIDVDLRSESEVEYYPDRYQKGTAYVNIPVYPFSKDVFKNLGIVNYMKLKLDNNNYADQSYVQMLVDKHARCAYRKVFDLLLANEKENQSLVFHCTAGKDRTGVAAFLILNALQVKPDEILNDYLLTNLFFQGNSAKEINELVTNDQRNALADKLNANLAVSADNFAILEKTCNVVASSMDDYLKKYLNLDAIQLKKLRSIYLE
nr:tyrosine-protein phosphatase [uncultured Ligilactobacillus sp.]